MKGLSSKLTEVERATETVAVIGALAERALHRFEEIQLSSPVNSSEVVAHPIHRTHPRSPFIPLL
jgi:hypothetical protein